MSFGVQKVVIEVDYIKLEELVAEKYPFIEDDYSFIATEECGNDSVHSFEVDGELDEYDLEQWNEMEKTGKVPCYTNRIILNKLCQDRYIDTGKYNVKVCW